MLISGTPCSPLETPYLPQVLSAHQILRAQRLYSVLISFRMASSSPMASPLRHGTGIRTPAGLFAPTVSATPKLSHGIVKFLINHNRYLSVRTLLTNSIILACPPSMPCSRHNLCGQHSGVCPQAAAAAAAAARASNLRRNLSFESFE